LQAGHSEKHFSFAKFPAERHSHSISLGDQSKTTTKTPKTTFLCKIEGKSDL
jgi:hypothetical protein